MCGGGAGTGVLEEESDERDYRTWRTFGGWCGNFLVSFWLILVRTPSKGGYGVSNVHLLSEQGFQWWHWFALSELLAEVVP